MNVAIVGKSQVNGILEKQLSEEGFNPFLFDKVEEIIGFSGEKLDYSVRTAGNSFNVGYVIVTEEPLNEKPFNNPDTIADGGEPVVFILDYPAESPAYFTVEALENAIRLARRKKQVLYLSRFMRTAGYQTESLYKEARNAGVTFIKYNYLTIDLDKDSGVYRIAAADGYDDIRIETPSVITAESAAPTGGMSRIAKVLRLKCGGTGFVNEDKSFLFPTLTSRNGIYFIYSTSLTSKEELLDRIRFTVSEIKNEAERSISDTVTALNGKGVDIDAGKCAFCYTCYRACPHSAMAPDYENSVMKNLKGSCQTCGICVSVCPADAVKMAGHAPMKAETEPKTLKILCCENSGEIAAHKLEDEYGGLFDKIEVVPVSCGGEIGVETIASALRQYDKVLVLTCTDEACKHFEGNKRAERFVEKAREMLQMSGMDADRVKCLKISHAMPYLLRDQIREMMD